MAGCSNSDFKDNSAIAFSSSQVESLRRFLSSWNRRCRSSSLDLKMPFRCCRRLDRRRIADLLSEEFRLLFLLFESHNSMVVAFLRRLSFDNPTLPNGRDHFYIKISTQTTQPPPFRQATPAPPHGSLRVVLRCLRSLLRWAHYGPTYDAPFSCLPVIAPLTCQLELKRHESRG